MYRAAAVWGLVSHAAMQAIALVTTRGSHRQFRHPEKPGKVTIPGKPSEDVGPKLWASIMNQAGLRRERR